MSGKSDQTVAATPIVVLDPDTLPKPTAEATERAKTERKKRAAEREEHILRARAIDEAGGDEAWIEAELRRQGLFVEGEPDDYKEKKKVEAAERRRLEKLVWQAYLATHVAHVGAGIFYADTNDEENRDRDARVARAKENGLLALDSPEALAKALGLTMPELRWLAFHREVETSTHYHFWTIPKRDGSRRLITAPKSGLKRVQRWLLRNVFEKLPVHRAAHGFLADRSIATNARTHAGADVIVKIDVKDFFPTVTFRRIKGMLWKAGLPENVSTLVALLATEPPREVVSFRGKTLYVAKGPRACPQGAPTSPAITNAICRRMDRRMSGLSRMLGFTYTRYADDLAFSWTDPEGASASRSSAPVGTLLHGVKQILDHEGFRIHAKKTAVMRAGMSQRITGLVVNRPTGAGAREDAPAARVPRDVVRRLRAAIFNREKGKPGHDGESLASLKGMAAFVYMTDPKRGRAFLERITALEGR